MSWVSKTVQSSRGKASDRAAQSRTQGGGGAGSGRGRKKASGWGGFFSGWNSAQGSEHKTSGADEGVGGGAKGRKQPAGTKANEPPKPTPEAGSTRSPGKASGKSNVGSGGGAATGPAPFKEVQMHDLPIHAQRAEFEKELARLRALQARHAADGTESAELSLKICAVAELLDDLVMYKPPPPSSTGHEYTFWLMNALRHTMSTSGGFLSPSLYIPQAVWLQRNSKLVRYRLKMDTCSTLLKMLIEIEADFTFNQNQISRLAHKLAEAHQRLDSMHEMLAYQLYEVKERKSADKNQDKKSRFGKIGDAIAKRTARLRNYALASRVTVEESRAYISVLEAIFQKAQFLRDVLRRYRSDVTICAAVHKVLNFLRNCVCTFVLADLRKFLDRYRAAAASTLFTVTLPTRPPSTARVTSATST